MPNFHELEYAVPVAHGKAAVKAVRKLMLEKYPECIYPIEYRFTAGDDARISPFFEQDSVTVSVSGEPEPTIGLICGMLTPFFAAMAHDRTGASCTFSPGRM